MIQIIFLLCIWTCISTGQQIYNLTLPWGTWEGVPYSNNDELYIFRNVRFGSQPVRFGPSQAPTQKNSSIQNSTYGPSCYQIDIANLKTPDPPGGKPGYGSPITTPPPDYPQSEDCLFLDIYVPKSALQPNAAPLPVVVWFYGGAYVYGNKLQFGPPYPMYTGQGIMEQAQNMNMIWVVGNYRLGAFGWLAGSYMEKAGLPNAGLHDQRLLLQWVQTYISQVGGDPKAVSAWGESAGAGSILHHLIGNNGQQDPLFSKALLQSPAFEWQWDREGTLNEIFSNFSSFTPCGKGFDIECLRDLPIDNITYANLNLFTTVHQTGLFPVGPSVDGTWIQDIPAVQFASGRYWQELNSIMVSHVADESGSFTPSYVDSSSSFNQFLCDFMPESKLSGVRDEIKKQYDCTQTPYNGNWTYCVSILIRDSTFTCNTRQLYDAYQGKAYMMQYSFPAPYGADARHATDLVPTFVNSNTNITDLLINIGNISPGQAKEAQQVISKFHPYYQSYLASYAVYGDPNMAAKNSVKWPLAQGTGDQIQSVLQAKFQLSTPFHLFFDVISDSINTQSSCMFWTKLAEEISDIGSFESQKPPSDIGNLEL
ncbi:alpha/beta-hydrolase [Patellaria atrata CBS 101060]|uniref:Alpha/beta-hydrolase n=1 Tax=Patellaria atrata CBS 101060 TaxID=1346257 RepID=A0A9P4VP72_9PEZI|nr:alpha/beta-hydrolase [Patellaria atrata CBS 101060]